VERKERGTCTSRPTIETPRTPRPELPETIDSLCLPSRERTRGDKETEEDEEVDKEEETDDEEERGDDEDGDKEGTEERTEEWSATMSRAAEASEQTYAIGDERTTERRPKPPKRTGRDTRRAKSPDKSDRRRRSEKMLRTRPSNQEAAGSKISGGMTRDRKERRGIIDERAGE
jgi:hypothetical protein